MARKKTVPAVRSGSAAKQKTVPSIRSGSAAGTSGATSLVGITLQTEGVIVPSGYHRLTDAPEVAAAIWWISDLVSSMTIHLMQNGQNGDIRIRDALARKVDINPWRLGTRQSLIGWITATMCIEGNAFVMPKTVGGMLDDLVPMPEARAQLRPDGSAYEVVWKGLAFEPDEVLHFALRPDPQRPWLGMGLRFPLQGIVDSIVQTDATKQAYMSSEYKPPLIVAVNSDSDLSDEKKREDFIEAYLKRKDPRTPLVIPADLMSVSQARPLSLNDLAVKDGVELDKRRIAALLGVPAYVVGYGSFNKDEHNACVRTHVQYIAGVEQQELTKKLLLSEERYFRFNSRSLYAYDLKELADIGQNLYIRGLMTGNEVRNWVGLAPKDGLDELVMLENFIPADDIGNQKKLLKEEENSDDETS